MKSHFFMGGIVVCLCVFVPAVSAGLVQGTSSCETGIWTFNDGSTYQYKYTIDLIWDYSDVSTNGVSYADINLSNMLLCPYSLFDIEGDLTNNIRFEDLTTYQADADGDGIMETYYYNSGIDGYSNSEEYPDDYTSVQWGGTVDADQCIEARIIRYQQPLEFDPLQPPAPDFPDPSIMGEGTFWFYSVFGPMVGTADVELKYSSTGLSQGIITGDLPYCEVPEPATLALLGFGGLVLLRKYR